MNSPQILIVDDRADNRTVLERVITELLPGSTVESASSASAGLARAAENSFDAALIDIQMPEMDGIQMCERLKTGEKTSRLPVILITSRSSSSELRARGLEAGADDFVNRPIDNVELVARLRAVLRVKAAEDELRALNDHLSEVVAEKTRALEFRHRIATVFLSGPDDEVYGDVLDLALEAVRGELGFFGILDGEGNLLCPSSRRCMWDCCRTTDGDFIIPRSEWGDLWHRALTERKLLLSNESISVPKRHPPLRRVLGVPLVQGEETIGIIAVADKATDYDEEDIRVLEAIAEHTSPILHARMERTRREEELRESKEKLSETEVQFRQAQKMEAVGKLAGGVAHDFNNLLTVIGGYGELIVSRLGPDHELLSKAQQITRAAKRAADLTHQLLAFSRRQVLEPKIVDLSQVLWNIESMLGRLIGEDVRLLTDSTENPWPVFADPSQLEQVIMNLAVNGRDAMPEGGVLTLETQNIVLDERFVSRHAGSSPGRHVMLAVSDTGCGMSEEVQAQAFEPFFTTKERGKGTGLGLSTVYGIVKQSGGCIFIDSMVGKGTSVRIYLPAARGEARTSTQREPGEEAPGGNEAILLVEDEEGVRSYATEVLQAAGYSVITATDGVEALAQAKAHEEGLDLLLTDVVMPGLGGIGLAEALETAGSCVKVLFTTGYAESEIWTQGRLRPGTNLLLKPFSPQELLQKVREALD